MNLERFKMVLVSIMNFDTILHLSKFLSIYDKSKLLELNKFYYEELPPYLFRNVVVHVKNDDTSSLVPRE